MKQLIPFKKDIIFKTEVSQITSISLEHTIKPTISGLISGDFIVAGTYKINDVSVNTEEFNHALNFEINLDDCYNILNASVDINDFYYEIINNEILRVNIELVVDNIELIERVEDNTKQEVLEEVKNIYDETRKEEIMEETIVKEVLPNNKIEEDVEARDIKLNIFNNLNETETFDTYHVYIVRENDTIEKIIELYNTDKETIALYNDISEIALGDKLIIPASRPNA